MVAIVSLLDAVHSEKVLQIILELEREFGLKAVQATPYPHITWLTVNDGSLPELKNVLGQAAGLCCSIKAQAMSLGVFTGPNPVLYIPIIRSEAMNHFHSQLFQSVQGISQEIGAYYHTGLWMPHISLALGDTTPEVVAQAMLYLNKYVFCWEIELDNLTLLTKSGDLFLKNGEYPLLNKKENSVFTITRLS